MKKLLLSTLTSILIISGIALATNDFPSFPMSFWGNVTINGSVAPTGSTIEAYYGNTLAGSITTLEAGKYGDNTATGPKLLISEGIGTISFKLTTSTGAQYSGVSYNGIFISGETVNFNLNFSPSGSSSGGVSSSSSGGGSSGGGSGGGGGSSGGGGLSSGSSNSPYSLSSTFSSTDNNLTDRTIQLPKSGETAGIFTSNVSVKHSKTGITTKFQKNTKTTTSDGSPFTGTLSTPNRVLKSGLPKNPPNDAKLVLGFNIGNEEHVYFDQPVEIIIPLSDDEIGNDNLVVYFYNEITEEYEKIENVKLSEDGKSLIITVNHFSLFVVVDSSEIESSNDNQEANIEKDNAFKINSNFYDLKDHWSKDYVDELFNRGIVKGKTNRTFLPDESTTRAEFLKMALLTKGIEISKSVKRKPFNDVYINDWHAIYIEVAKNYGIISGYQDGSFKPDSKISRAEALSVLFKIQNESLLNSKNKIFDDVPLGMWYTNIVNKAYEEGIISGINENGKKLFLPNNSITRAEASKIIVKYFLFNESK